MKVLGKKRQNDIETIEAYDIWGCAGIHVCSYCGAEYNVTFQGLNDQTYTLVRMGEI